MVEKKPAPLRADAKTLPALKVAEIPVCAAVAEAAPIVTVTRKSEPCCWPIGEPRKPSFHFCNAAAVPGRAYCDDHAAIAYVRVRDWREDAA